MKALHASLLFFLLTAQFTLCIAKTDELTLISKDYQLISVDDPKNLNDHGLFFPPNVIQFDEENNLSYHLIDRNKIAFKQDINGALQKIITLPNDENNSTISSIVLDTKRNQLWILINRNLNYIYDISTATFTPLKFKKLGSDYYLHSAVYDRESDSTFITYASEGNPGIVQISNSTHVSEYINNNLEDFSSYRQTYSLLKKGSDFILWEGAFFSDKMWTFNKESYLKTKSTPPRKFKPTKLFDNDIAASEWWGVLPRTPYTQNIIGNIATLTVNNTSLCENFKNEVADNYTSGKHLFDPYRQNVFGLNKFDFTKLTQSPVGYSFETKIDDTLYYISPRTVSGCGSRCETQFTAITSEPLKNTRNFLDNHVDYPKPVPDGQHKLATDDSGQLFYVSFDNESYFLHKFNQGKWLHSCTVQIKTAEQSIDSSPISNDLKTELTNNLHQLSITVEKMIGDQGTGVTCRGTNNVNFVRKESFNNILSRITTRPHQFTSIGNYSKTFDILQKWSLGGIYEYEIYKTFNRTLLMSLNSLSNYYQKQFKLPPNEADTIADFALKTAIGSGFYAYNYNPYPETFELRKAILEKQSLKSIESKITQSAHTEQESMLNLAVGYPEVIKLLIKHAFDVNQQNEFGKTALMYAAQQNKFESIKILLEAGADPNLMTHQPINIFGCIHALKTTNLSSLHYAVRFADLKSVKSLIDAGAWLEIKALNKYDKYTRTALDWLAEHKEENQSLSKEDVKKLETLLIPKQGEELRRATKKLTIKAEKHYQDGQLDMAYELLKLITSSDPQYIRALSDFALVSLKTENFEDALTINKRILELSKKESEKASAYFNIGLTCERIPENNQISYSKRRICDKGLLPNFVEALLLKQTTSRKNKVQELINKTEEYCTFENNNDFTAKIHMKSISRYSFITSYTKNHSKSIEPIDYAKRLNLKNTTVINVPPSNYIELRKLNKKVIFAKKEVDMVNRMTYKDNDIYIEKISFAKSIDENKIRELCQ